MGHPPSPFLLGAYLHPTMTHPAALIGTPSSDLTEGTCIHLDLTDSYSLQVSILS